MTRVCALKLFQNVDSGNVFQCIGIINSLLLFFSFSTRSYLSVIQMISKDKVHWFRCVRTTCCSTGINETCQKWIIFASNCLILLFNAILILYHFFWVCARVWLWLAIVALLFRTYWSLSSNVMLFLVISSTTLKQPSSGFFLTYQNKGHRLRRLRLRADFLHFAFHFVHFLYASITNKILHPYPLDVLARAFFSKSSHPTFLHN